MNKLSFLLPNLDLKKYNNYLAPEFKTQIRYHDNHLTLDPQWHIQFLGNFSYPYIKIAKFSIETPSIP
jgi:hypothetical protein